MKLEHWAVPITSLDGMLLGVELETRVLINGCRVLMGQERKVNTFVTWSIRTS